MKLLVVVIVLVWLAIGVAASAQRGYFTGDRHCSGVSDPALTIVAGPLNYAGVNPKVTCKVPQPSQ